MACDFEADVDTIVVKPVPFATVYVTLTKQEHIELVTQAAYWKSCHPPSHIAPALGRTRTASGAGSSRATRSGLAQRVGGGAGKDPGLAAARVRTQERAQQRRQRIAGVGVGPAAGPPAWQARAWSQDASALARARGGCRVGRRDMPPMRVGPERVPRHARLGGGGA